MSIQRPRFYLSEKDGMTTIHSISPGQWYPDDYAGYNYGITEVFVAFRGSTFTAHKSLQGAMEQLQPGMAASEWYAATLNGKKGDLWYARDTNLRMLRIERRDLNG